jgi:HlyD family secretion protein
MFNEDFGLEREEARATIGSGSRQTVYVLKDDGEIEPIEVVTGQTDGRFTVVTSDELKTGMKVVTSYKAAEG